MNRLSVPQERLKVLKSPCDAELLRLYMGTGTMADMNAIYTVLRIGGAMLKFVEEKAEAQAAIDRGHACLSDRGHACLSQYCAHPTPNPNLDDLRNALEVVYQIWALLSIEEFVEVCRALRKEAV